MKWEFLKYKIQKFRIDNSKTAAKIRKQQKIDFITIIKRIRDYLWSHCRQHKNKKQMWMIWTWGEIHEVLFKSSKKKRGVQNQIRKLIVEEKEITYQKEIYKKIKASYETLFKQNFSKTNVKKQRFFNSLSTKTLRKEQYDLCKNKISKTNLFDSMKSMKNIKTPNNDGLTKEFMKLSGMNWKLL